jgi:hypothetical protein
VVELQELLEGPLLGPEGNALKTAPRDIPEEYSFWFDAQLHSEEASKHTKNYEGLIHPLSKTKDHRTLENMWKCINLVRLFEFFKHFRIDGPFLPQRTINQCAEKLSTRCGS